MPAPASRDAVALLKADHRRIEDLFARFDSAQGAARKLVLAEQICMELTVHTRIEEDIFYPACAGFYPACAGAVERNLLREARIGDRVAMGLIAEIRCSGPADKFYDAKVKVLCEMVEHHVEQAEAPGNGMFNQARRAGLDLDDLGRRIAEAKAQLVAEYSANGLPTTGTALFEGAPR
jgi:hypothetical protein